MKEQLLTWGRGDLVQLWEDYEKSETHCLASAFCWDDTPQGYDFWLDVDRALYINDPLLLPEMPNKLTERWK